MGNLQADAVWPLRPMTFTMYAIEDGLTAQEADLPEPFASRLNEINDAVDCYGGCWVCGDGIGWVLHEDDDNPNNSGVRWHAVYLVREGDGPVSPECEVCAPQSPGMPYPRPASGRSSGV